MTTDITDTNAEEVTEEQVRAAEEKLSRLEQGILREAAGVVDSGDLSRAAAGIYLGQLGLPGLPPRYTYTATLRLTQEVTYLARASSEEEARKGLDELIQCDQKQQHVRYAWAQKYPDKQNELRIQNAVITSDRPDTPDAAWVRPVLYADDASLAQKLAALTARTEELGQAVTKIIADGKANHNWRCDQVQETLNRLGLPPLPQPKTWQVEVQVATSRICRYEAVSEEEAIEKARGDLVARGYELVPDAEPVVWLQD